jgi:hypothetical protein
MLIGKVGGTVIVIKPKPRFNKPARSTTDAIFIQSKEYEIYPSINKKYKNLYDYF